MPIKQVSVELGWGPAKLSGVWEPEDAERRAAWELYVELVTRIAVVPLRPADGILREALTSLYQLFGCTREILRRYGPDVARPAAPGRLRFGYLAIWVLNGVRVRRSRSGIPSFSAGRRGARLTGRSPITKPRGLAPVSCALTSRKHAWCCWTTRGSWRRHATPRR